MRWSAEISVSPLFLHNHSAKNTTLSQVSGDAEMCYLLYDTEMCFKNATGKGLWKTKSSSY